MTTRAKRFPAETLAAFDETKYLWIRSGDHRFIPIWAVVVDGHVIVRSWNDKAHGWYRAFLEESRGAVRFESPKSAGKSSVGEVAVLAVPLRGKKLNDAADAAYAAKYTTKPNFKYVEGFKTARRKACTLELTPA